MLVGDLHKPVYRAMGAPRSPSLDINDVAGRTVEDRFLMGEKCRLKK